MSKSIWFTAVAVSILLICPEAGSVVITGKAPVSGESRVKPKPKTLYPGRVVRAEEDSQSRDLKVESSTVVFLIPKAYQELPRPTKRVRLDQLDFTFIPHILPIQTGTTVDFYNLDAVFHNVFSFSKPKRFDLGRYPKGSFKSVTFDKRGLIKVFCEIHSDMSAYVLVVETPYIAIAGNDGAFTLADVPPGDYYLKVWQERGDAYQAEVKIPDAQSCNLTDMSFGILADPEKLFE